jgi:hypothetical protein
MTDNEILELYTSSLEAHHCQPKDGELDAWKKVLQQFKRAHLDAALRRWLNDTTLEEYTGRPRGSRMPSPAELKASIESFERATQSSITGRFEPCRKGGCEGGWVPVGVNTGVHMDLRRRVRCQCFSNFIQLRKGAA